MSKPTDPSADQSTPIEATDGRGSELGGATGSALCPKCGADVWECQNEHCAIHGLLWHTPRPKTKGNLIQVTVCLFPNGTTLWMRGFFDEKVKEAVRRWLDAHRDYEWTGCVAAVRMPEEDYNALWATSESHELTKPNAEISHGGAKN